MKTIQEFISEHGLTMESAPAPENPNIRRRDDDKWYAAASHFYITIKSSKTGAMFSTYHSVGGWIVERWIFDNGPDRIHTRDYGFVTRESARMVSERKTLASLAYMDAARGRYRPDIESVLDCLVSDAHALYCGSFEDWANEYGYDADSRSAEKIYRGCIGIARSLRATIGTAALRELMEQVRWAV